MPDQDLEDCWVERELRGAVRAKTLALHYQPIRATEDLSLVAYESLVRWPHPVRGMVAPSRFIPTAERSGLIHDLGYWVVRQACRDVARLGSRYVGVNVSPMQLRRVGFAARYGQILSEEGAASGQVTVEVTESVALHSDGPERRNLHALRDLGCWLAIDDFGTGHASLDYLDRFPFNALKLDKSFIAQLGRHRTAFDFVARMCELGARRDVVIIAEGVETDEQFSLLREAGCTRAQGYLLGRPAPVGFWAEVPTAAAGRRIA